jgi:protoheme IX farnesyltransferase
LGLWFLVQSVLVLRERDATREPAAKRLFGITLLYLFALFAALIGERLAHIAPFASWM